MSKITANLASITGTCPGLAIGDDGLVWVDTLGRCHVLARAVRLSIGAVATRMGRSEDTVLRRITAGELYPVLRHSARDIEVYAVAVDDYFHRATMRTAVKKEAVRA